MPEFLLNFSTHAKDLALFRDDWEGLARFVASHGFQGVELYPVGEVDVGSIPGGLVRGVHLRFFIMIRHILNGDLKALERIFGDLETAKKFYGGLSRDVVLKTYVAQLDLASQLGASYVVFHPVEVMLDQVYDWTPRHTLEETLSLHCDLINEVMSMSPFRGLLLFENLWWPWGFTLKDPGEFEFILSRMEYERCGIVLDTGHMIVSEGGFDDEEQAVHALVRRVKGLACLSHHIHAIHLTCTLSGQYLKNTRGTTGEVPEGGNFWQRLQSARRHVMELDRHDPFTLPGIEVLIDIIQPSFVVFELRYGDLHTWQEKIQAQKDALGERFFK